MYENDDLDDITERIAAAKKELDDVEEAIRAARESLKEEPSSASRKTAFRKALARRAEAEEAYSEACDELDAYGAEDDGWPC